MKPSAQPASPWCPPVVARFLLVVCLMCTTRSACAGLLYFSPTMENGMINYSWFSTINWYFALPANPTNAANRLPDDTDTVVLPGDELVIIGPNSVEVNTLDANGFAYVQGGNITALYINTVTTTFTNSTLTIEKNGQWTSTGGDTLMGSTVNIDPGAQLFLDGNTLILSDSTLYDIGGIELMNGGELDFGAGSNLVSIQPNAQFMSIGTNKLINPGGTVTFDNNGIVQSQGGILYFDMNNVLWTNSDGTGQFVTITSNDIIEFYNSFTVQTNNTNVITGPGVVLFNTAAGMTINGLLQIGIGDPTPGIADFYANGGTISGAGQVDVIGSPGLPSTLIWEFGTLAGPTVNVDEWSALVLTNWTKLLSNSIINNAGTTTWVTDHANFQMANGAVFNNELGALFDIQNSAEISNEGGANPTFINNAGTFRKSVSTNRTYFGQDVPPSPSPFLINTGVVDAQAGALQLEGGTNYGQYNVASGAALQIIGGTNVQMATASYTGPGLLDVTGYGADFWLAANVQMNTLQVDSSGTVDGPGTLTIDGLLTLNYATVEGTGGLAVNSNATLMAEGNYSSLARNVLNAGTVTVTNSGLQATQGIVWSNMPGGTLNLQSGTLTYAYSGSPPVLLNAGSILNSASNNSRIDWNTTNSGLITISPQSLNFSQSLTQTAGVIQVQSQASLIVGSQMLLIQGGTLEGLGQVNAQVINSGTIHPGDSPGILTVVHNVTNQPGAQFAVDIAGTVPGTQYSQLNNNGQQASLNNLGLAITWDNGFVPSVGESFVIWTNAQISGTFDSLKGIRPGGGIVLVPEYGLNSVTLIAAEDAVLSSPTVRGGTASFTFQTTAGHTNIVEFTPSLSPANWQVLTNFIGDGTVKTFIDPTATVPERFYRIILE